MFALAKKRRYKKSSCPDPINAFLDIAGAATLGMYVKHRVKKDFEAGCVEESAKAAAAVFGLGSMKRGSQGTINLGGLIGLNSALKDIERQNLSSLSSEQPPFVSPIEKKPAIQYPVKTGIWRESCEDGSAYGVSPEDYDNADDYEDALRSANQASSTQHDTCIESTDEKNQSKAHPGNQYRWRLHCEDGSKYGIFPENYETADDYEDALEEAKAMNGEK